MRHEVVLVIDNGWYMDIATRLARDFETVMYWSPWQRDFPAAAEQAVGRGISGIRRVNDYFTWLDHADIVVVPDLYFAPLVEYLRREGKRVWGSGAAEALETDRLRLRLELKEHKIPVIPYELVSGVDALGERLRDGEPDVWVKLVGSYRGDSETFHHINWKLSEGWYYDLHRRLGPMGRNISFIIEQSIPGLEVGYDGFCVSSSIATAMYGYEVKDAGYIGVVGAAPKIVQPSLKALVDMLGPHYANFLSTETRIGEDGTGYFIDLCCRAPSPPYGMELENVVNLAEVVANGAAGVATPPEYAHKFGCELILNSSAVHDGWVAINIPPDVRRWVKLHSAVGANGLFYLPKSPHGVIGNIVGLGNTKQAAVHAALDVAEQLEGEGLNYNKGALQEAMKRIDEGEKYGIKFD